VITGRDKLDQKQGAAEDPDLLLALGYLRTKGIEQIHITIVLFRGITRVSLRLLFVQLA
jgi:hypothetical protein